MKQLTKILFLLAIVASFFASCVTEKKQRGRALSFFQQHPQELAAICGDQFPPAVHPGKDSITHDTTYTAGKTVECPPVLVKTEKGKDSVIYRYVQCPPDTSIRTKHSRVDTVENTAKIAALQFQRDSLIFLLRNRTAERDKARKEAENRLWYMIGLVSIIGIGVFLRLKKII
jgi:hypothetical protein